MVYPTLNWSLLQSSIECIEADVLILLDICNAARSANFPIPNLAVGEMEKGRTEPIASCGFESNSPGIGPASFTQALIDVLIRSSHDAVPFTAAQLHRRILSRLRPIRHHYFSRRDPRGLVTPVRITLSGGYQCPSIPLQIFRFRRQPFLGRGIDESSRFLDEGEGSSHPENSALQHGRGEQHQEPDAKILWGRLEADFLTLGQRRQRKASS